MKWHRPLWIFGTFVLTAVTFSVLRYSEHTGPWQNFYDPVTNVTLEYPAQMVSRPLSDEDRQDKIIFRASEGLKETRVLLVTLRYEDGLAILPQTTDRDLLDILVENSGRLLPDRFPDYQKHSERRLEVNGKRAAELIFTYQGPAGERIKQRFLIVVRDDDLAVYLAAQAKDSDFAQINKQYFARMFESLRFE